jgi:hypothetical protein
MSFWPAVSALVGVYSAYKSSKAQSDAASEASKLSKPMLKAQQFALPTLRDLILKNLLPQVGQESPLLRGEHAENVQGITRTGLGALAGSRRYWGAAGNVGRSRGEQFRIGQATTEATNRENLAYGGAQEGYKRQSLADALSATSNLAGLGGQGIQPAMAGLQMGAEAKSNLYGDVAGIVGDLASQYDPEERRLRDAILNQLGQGKKTSGGGDSIWDWIRGQP